MRGLLVPVLAAFSMLAAETCWSQQYTLTNLGTLGGNYTVGFAINDSGQVVGSSALQQVNGASPQHPFLWSNGTMTDLGTFGGANGTATAISANGHAVGAADDAGLGSHVFLWNGALQALDPTEESRGSGLNNSDDVVLAIGSEQPGGDGYLYENGVLTPLPHGSYTRMLPSGINNAGVIAGSCQTDYAGPNRACKVVNGALSTLASGGNSSVGAAINQAGDICGYSTFSSNIRATLWRNGARVNLGRLHNGRDSECNGLNDFAQEVGQGRKGPNFTSPIRAVLFDPVNGARNLNSITGRPTGWILTQAFGINNNGAIIALCVVNGQADRACLLTPNPALVFKKNITALAVGDPGCIECGTVLEPEAQSLPNSLAGLTTAQKAQVTKTVEQMIGQLSQLAAGQQITSPQDQLLEHQGHLVLQALQVE
jgi:probable HAF family extracellular repeat protein